MRGHMLTVTGLCLVLLVLGGLLVHLGGNPSAVAGQALVE